MPRKLLIQILLLAAIAGGAILLASLIVNTPQERAIGKAAREASPLPPGVTPNAGSDFPPGERGEPASELAATAPEPRQNK